MLLEQLPTEVQALVCRHLGPHDLRSLLIAMDRRLHHLFAHFSDHPESLFFDTVPVVPTQNLECLGSGQLAAINIIEITKWAAIDLKELCTVLLNRSNVFVITLDANPDDPESLGSYENLNYFIRSFLPTSHILLQQLVSGITLNEADIVYPSHLTIAHSEDVHIHAPDSLPGTTAVKYHAIENLSIESYSSQYLLNYDFQHSPTHSLHLDSIEPFTLSNVTISAESAAIEGVRSIQNTSFTGTSLTLVAHPHLATMPNSREPVCSFFENVNAPNVETGAFFFHSIFPRIKNIHAPQLKHVSLLSCSPHDFTLDDLPIIDTHVESDFSYLENLISIDLSIFDAPLLQCPRFPNLHSMSLELIRPLDTKHIFPSLKRFSVTLIGPYQGLIPEINAPLVQQYTLTVHHTARSAILDNVTSTLRKFRPLRSLNLEIQVPVTDLFQSKLKHYLESTSYELKSLRLLGLPPLDIISNKRYMMPSLLELNLKGSFSKLSISFYAPKLHSIMIKSQEKLSKVKICGFPKLEDLTIRSPVDSLSLTRVPEIRSVFVGGYVHSIKADYLPVVRELMYTIPPGASVEMVEMVDFINPKVHRADHLNGDDVWVS